jgi:FkbM family methyltransferase
MRVIARRGGRALTVDTYGNHILIDRSHFLDAYLLASGSYEGENIDLLLRRAPAADLFIDIGSNFGIFSLPLAKHLPVIAFEPDSRNVGQLRANVWLNDAQVDVRQVALSDREGMALLHLSRDRIEGDFGMANPGTSSLVAHARHHTSAHNEEVPTATLDGALGTSGKRLLIKIDVEGHELAVAAGMAQTMAGNDCLILAEVFADHLADWDGLMRSRFYQPLATDAPAQHYCVYAKSDSFARRVL